MKAIAFLTLATLTAPLARPADNDSIDSVVRAVYSVISGPAGTRDWARFRSLFADGARLISMRHHGGRRRGAGNVAGRLRQAGRR